MGKKSEKRKLLLIDLLFPRCSLLISGKESTTILANDNYGSFIHLSLSTLLISITFFNWWHNTIFSIH